MQNYLNKLIQFITSISFIWTIYFVSRMLE